MSRVAEVLSCTGIERVKFILLSLTHTEEYPRLKWSLEPYADILFVIDFVGILGSLAYHLFRGSENVIPALPPESSCFNKHWFEVVMRIHPADTGVWKIWLEYLAVDTSVGTFTLVAAPNFKSAPKGW